MAIWGRQLVAPLRCGHVPRPGPLHGQCPFKCSLVDRFDPMILASRNRSHGEVTAPSPGRTSGRNNPVVRIPDVEGLHPTALMGKARSAARISEEVGLTGPTAVERAYETHFATVYRYVLALTRSREDAEDITAEVFERALRAWTREPDRVEAWLLLTARRIATDRWRRTRRLLRRLPRLHETTVLEPATQVEFWTWFDALSEVLTDHQREVLVLRYHRELTDADIATIMGLSPSGVRSLVARALDALRSHPEVLE